VSSFCPSAGALTNAMSAGRADQDVQIVMNPARRCGRMRGSAGARVWANGEADADERGGYSTKPFLDTPKCDRPIACGCEDGAKSVGRRRQVIAKNDRDN
jgi:hypothetical protein